MCGIVGVYGEGAGELDLPTGLLVHRGPDSEGAFQATRLAMATRRLAIIDPVGGDQPLASEDGRVVCICNGEIYNYVELRRELEQRGHRFATGSDVEVIPHLYEELGDECFGRLRGMFAAAVWDGSAERLVLARDRYGIKPLYLADVGGRLAFASEIAPLLSLGADDRPDTASLGDYLALGWVSGEATGLAGVRRLLPGRLLRVDASGRSVRRFAELEQPAEATDLESVLREAVRIHLRSDVPLAVLLSGGLDSSLIAAYAADELGEPPATFTVGFEDGTFDERAPAREVARAIGSRHTELLLRPAVADDLPAIVAALEQPIADPSAIPLWYLCRAVAEHVKVALAGEGGDEVFGGYARYAWDPLAARLGRLFPSRPLARVLAAVPAIGRRARGSRARDPLRRAVKLLDAASLPPAERYRAWFALAAAEDYRALSGDATSETFERLLARAPQGLGAVGRLQYVDLNAMLADDLLVKADKVSMRHSLELRVPFLDNEVVRTGLFLPDREKVRGVQTKVALRRLVERRLPAAIARRPKQGFDVPIDEWLRGDLRDLAGDVIADGSLDGVIDTTAARSLFDAHAARRVDAGAAVYALVVLGLWRAGIRSATPR